MYQKYKNNFEGLHIMKNLRKKFKSFKYLQYEKPNYEIKKSYHLVMWPI